MSDRIMTFLSGCCAPFLIWMVLSWFDVISNSMDGAVHAWNLFMLLAH